MPFTDDLIDLFNRVITIEPLVSTDVAGKPTYGPAVSYMARVEMKDVGVRTAEGTIIVGRGRMWLPAVYPITTRDRLTMPVGMTTGGPDNPPILSVSTVDDEVGGSYTALIIG